MDAPTRFIFILMLLMLSVRHVDAATLSTTPANYRFHLSRLQPGDTLRLAGGEYLRGLPVHGLVGTADHPITIEGPADGEPAVFVAREGHNTISIIDAAHVVIRNLVLDGRGLRVDGVKCEGHASFAHHITLEGLRISGHGATQQTVGISTKCPAWNWMIRGNVVTGAGTGMYLGNSDGSDPFVAGSIERNVIADSIGYNLQIKHQQPRLLLPGMPRGPSETVIRNNAFLKVAPQDPQAAPRPSVLFGHWPLEGAGRDDRYLIENNFFFGNPAPGQALLQAEGNLVVRGNLLLAPQGDAIRIQPHNDVPREVLVEGNTVRALHAGIVLLRGPGSSAYRQQVRNNVVIAAEPVTAGFEGGNALQVRRP